jgi:hypothetical protein
MERPATKTLPFHRHSSYPDGRFILGNSANLTARVENDRVCRGGIMMMENVMRKTLTATAIGAAMICLMHGTASAQLPAPIGHRQPTAETVPADDSVRGSALHTEHRSVAAPMSKSQAANPFDDGMNFPNICSNCDQ